MSPGKRSHLNKVMSTSVAPAAVMIVGFAVSGRAKSPRFGMTAEIPPGIASPDKVETAPRHIELLRRFP